MNKIMQFLGFLPTYFENANEDAVGDGGDQPQAGVTAFEWGVRLLHYTSQPAFGCTQYILKQKLKDK